MNKTRLLFLTILIEGYVVLTSELLAIRKAMAEMAQTLPGDPRRPWSLATLFRFLTGRKR